MWKNLTSKLDVNLNATRSIQKQVKVSNYVPR